MQPESVTVSARNHFDIYDPVRVYESLEDVNTMKPVVTNPAASFTELLDGFCVMTDRQGEHFVDLSGGKTPAEFAEYLRSLPPKHQCFPKEY